jgi:hypothetical protein
MLCERKQLTKLMHAGRSHRPVSVIAETFNVNQSWPFYNPSSTEGHSLVFEKVVEIDEAPRKVAFSSPIVSPFESHRACSH